MGLVPFGHFGYPRAARARVAQDESSIKAFFEKYANADFDDPETRDTVLSYFIDKIYLYDDGHFKVTGWYWDFEHEIKSDLFEDLPERASGFEYSLDLDPEGFACFADGGTRPRRAELGFNRYQFALRIWME